MIQLLCMCVCLSLELSRPAVRQPRPQVKDRRGFVSELRLPSQRPTDWEGLNNRNLLSRRPGAWKSKIQVVAGSVSSEAPLHGALSARPLECLYRQLGCFLPEQGIPEAEQKQTLASEASAAPHAVPCAVFLLAP